MEGILADVQELISFVFNQSLLKFARQQRENTVYFNANVVAKKIRRSIDRTSNRRLDIANEVLSSCSMPTIGTYDREIYIRSNRKQIIDDLAHFLEDELISPVDYK